MTKPKREITCPHCGNKMQSRAKGTTRCGKCKKPFSPKEPLPTPPVMRVGVEKTSATNQGPATISVEHVPEMRGEPEAPPAPGGPEQEEQEQAQMISPIGLYSIFIELPNNLYIMIFPDLEPEMTLTPQEEDTMKKWAESLYDYCVRHGITIPDYLELLPIVLIPFGFHVKRIRQIGIKRAQNKAARAPKTPDIPSTTEVNVKAAQEAKAGKVDMKALDARMEHTTRPTSPSIPETPPPSTEPGPL